MVKWRVFKARLVLRGNSWQVFGRSFAAVFLVATNIELNIF